MNLEKATLKMQLAQHYARQLEGQEGEVQRDLYRLEGTFGAMRQAAAALEGHRPYYQAATDAGELDLAQCKLAMDVITKCAGGIQSLADKATLSRTLKQGELAGVRRSIATLERDFKSEQAKVLSLSAAGDHDARPTVAAAEDIQRRRQSKKEGRPTKKATARRAKKKAS